MIFSGDSLRTTASSLGSQPLRGGSNIMQSIVFGRSAGRISSARAAIKVACSIPFRAALSRASRTALSQFSMPMMRSRSRNTYRQGSGFLRLREERKGRRRRHPPASMTPRKSSLLSGVSPIRPRQHARLWPALRSHRAHRIVRHCRAFRLVSCLSGKRIRARWCMSFFR
jgi:hypothetical protein